MKIYVFLTYLLDGFSGGPSYVRNKKIWLESKGWKVFAFDLMQKKIGVNDISYSELRDYADNRIFELSFHPSWFSSSRRDHILDMLIHRLRFSDAEYVIESNSVILSEWGELLAQRLKAKHLIYILGENSVINDLQEYKFMQYKYLRNELFSINNKAFKLLLSKFENIDNDNSHYWNAMSDTLPQNVDFPEFTSLPNADFTICHFGRTKLYFPYMVQELCAFANDCKGKTINLVFMGSTSLSENLVQQLNLCSNIKFFTFASHFPIPQIIFEKSDVIIATAGCAIISFESGAKTISMNVKTNHPLGVLGYTTNQISYSVNNEETLKNSLSDLLKGVLLRSDFDTPPCLGLEGRDHGYEYQLACANYSHLKPDYYNKILSLKDLHGIQKYIAYVFIKLGFVKFVKNMQHR